MGILVMLAIANAFVFLAALGSSHNVPTSTFVAFAVSFFGLVAMVMAVAWSKKKLNR
jgi:hypothetical protein